MTMITTSQDYFDKGCGRCDRFDTADCATRIWADGLRRLRQICLEVGLVETAKWGHPCYMHAGRNIVLIGAFRGDFQLGFFDAALMTDPDRVLEKQGPNTAHAGTLRFADADQVTAREPLIRAYLAEAMGYAAAGITAPKDTRDLELPPELIDALDHDPELAEGFARLTPGRQKSYVIALSSAKTAATRVARVVRFRDHILAGKGATER